MTPSKQPEETKGYGRRHGYEKVAEHPNEGPSLLRKDAPKFFAFVVTHLQGAYPFWYDCKRVTTAGAKSKAPVPWKMPRAWLVAGVVEALVKLMLCDRRVGIHGLGKNLYSRLSLCGNSAFRGTNDSSANICNCHLVNHELHSYVRKVTKTVHLP